MFLWRIAAVTADFDANDLDGQGAEKNGGRWNEKGTPLVYTSIAASTAMLEVIAHINAPAMNRYLIRIEVPDDLWHGRIQMLKPPLGWDAVPDSIVSRKVGQQFVANAQHPLLVVPSVIVPEDHNVLINPRHPDAGRIEVDLDGSRKLSFDLRLI